MKGLSQELIARCHKVLSRCEEFDSQKTLRAVFVTEQLVLYQGRLPDAGSSAERISLTIDYLRLQYLSDSQPVMPLFLAALRDRRPSEDALRDELDQLVSETHQELSEIETIDIPFVVAAMTQDEAVELAKETILDNPEIPPIESSRVQQFKETLLIHRIVDWEACYGQNREDWKPITCPDRTIDEIIVGMVDHINRCTREPESLSVIRRQMFSESFFTMDRNIRMETWDYLIQSGGVLIVDAISLFHPFLRSMLLQSALLSYEKTAVLVLSPLNSSDFPINNLIEDLIRTQMEMAFSRYDERLDGRCEISTGGLRTVQRWLIKTLPETADIAKQQMVIANRRVVREKVAQETHGIEKAIFMVSEA